MDALTNPPRRPLLAAASLLCLVVGGTAFVVMSGADGSAPAAAPQSSAPSSSAPGSTASTPGGAPSSVPSSSTTPPPAPLRLAAGVKVKPAPKQSYVLSPLTETHRAKIAAAFGVTGLAERDGIFIADGLSIWPSGQWSYVSEKLMATTPTTTSTAPAASLLDEAAARREAERIVKALGVEIERVTVSTTPRLRIVRITTKHEGVPLLPPMAFAFSSELVSASGLLPRDSSESTYDPMTLEEVLSTPDIAVSSVNDPGKTATVDRVTVTSAAAAWLVNANPTTARLIPGWVLTAADGSVWAVAADAAYRPFVPNVAVANP